tara:strand:+ start:6766 stop:6984 length:219 start_codon:yes stop_codon:yes gene_type:complete
MRFTGPSNREARITLENAIKYLKIIEDMEKTNPDWYIEFRNHEDWEYGLTTTIAVAKQWLISSWFVLEGEEE